MKFEFAKSFYFSASFSREGKVFGHNYALTVSMDCPDEKRRFLIENKIQESLIQKIHSRDLGLHVDFLKGVELTEENLLKIFWSLIEKNIHPVILRSLSLEKDSRTKLTLRRENGHENL
jgi:6-pyruvoyl-tetrahydropterin synthase